MGQVCIEGDCMPIFKVGDRVKILDKPNWPYEGYKIASWEGTIIRVVEDPAGCVMMKADKTGYNMLFHEKGLEKIQPATDVV